MQLWTQARTQSHPGSTTSESRQPGSHVIERECQQFFNSPRLHATPSFSVPHLLPRLKKEQKESSHFYMKPPNSPRDTWVRPICTDQSFLFNNEQNYNFNKNNCLIFLLAVLSVRRNYKICQDLNHQYDLNCVEILICCSKTNQRDIGIFFNFNFYLI